MRRGSATILSIVIMLFVLTAGGGLLAWITNETRLVTDARDLLEAQYAAEAGAKRAIVEFNKFNAAQTPDWSWLNTDRPFTEAAVSQKRYRVTTRRAGGELAHVTPVATIDATYLVQSTGTVNKAVRTIRVEVAVTTGGSGGSTAPPPAEPDYVGDAALYSGQNIHFKNKAVVHGASTCSAGETVRMHDITYDSGYGLVEYKRLDMPATAYAGGVVTVGAKTYDFSQATALASSTSTITLSSTNNYAAYASGNWAPKGDVVINGSGVLYIGADLALSGNIICTDPAGVLIVVKGDLVGADKNSNQTIIDKAAVLVDGAVENFKNKFTLTGALVAGAIKGEDTFKNHATFYYDAKTASTWLPTTSNGGNASGRGGSASAAVVPQSWQLN